MKMEKRAGELGKQALVMGMVILVQTHGQWQPLSPSPDICIVG